jgi:hypothetical protein
LCRRIYGSFVARWFTDALMAAHPDQAADININCVDFGQYELFEYITIAITST